MFALARQAESYAHDGLSARLWNLAATLRAVRQGWPLGQLAFDSADGVLDRRVDLILHRAIACPTGRHVRYSEGSCLFSMFYACKSRLFKRSDIILDHP
jgi:hypothetical protein